MIPKINGKMKINNLLPWRNSANWVKNRRYAAGYIMIIPFIILFIVFYVVPICWSLFLSLNSFDLFQPMRFAGLNNFINLFTNDDLFIIALRNTLTYAVFAGPIGFVCSFLFAWIICQLKFKNIFSLAFYAPSIVSVFATTYIWAVLFSSDRNGTINKFLLDLGVINDPIYWTNDPGKIMPMVIFISVWMSMGAGFLTNLAGFSSVNPEIYEAAKIDGIRNRFQELIYVTIPQMKPQLLFNAVMSTVGSLAVADVITTMVGYPTPDNSAHTMAMHMYDYAFQRFEMGYAAAISFMLFLITFFFGRIFMKILADNK